MSQRLEAGHFPGHADGELSGTAGEGPGSGPGEPPLRPALLPDEHAAFVRVLKTSATYLEFGCGGSTRSAVEIGVRRIFSVESDGGWIMRCRRDPVLAKAIEDERLTMHFARVGPVGRYGRPNDRKFLHAWPNYYLTVWDRISGSLPDTVFVDGRFRVACVYQALLRLPPQANILFHDFVERPHYHVVLEHAELIEQAGRLAVLRRSPRVSSAEIAVASYRFLFDSRWRMGGEG